MDPPPFNFNTAANSTGTTNQPAPSAFGSSVPKATFGSSLFGKPSVLAQAVKRETEKPAERSDSSKPLGSRLTINRTKETLFKAKGDQNGLQEGTFKIRPKTEKSGFGIVKRRVREATPEDGGVPKPIRPTLQAPIFSAIGRREATDGHDETDHALRREPPPSMFGAQTSTSSIRSFGSMPSLQADKAFKPVRLKNRESPAPSNSEETRLVQKLAGLRGQVCPGDYEKYMVLDERDKILCQLREIDSDLVRRLKRCEEMCTEKERYQRIVQKGASPFECDLETGEVAHEMMVKQYARSAADQERPLPHELRSEKIMNHAMGYLLHNILDEFPESAEQRAAWYNFLWSRTRALRKEVTQLSMSDNQAVNLVEQCTRLHILFGYVLCDLETEHFDAAMNNETLAKCLQTLRHLYEDFSKRGIPCANEPEFRAYDVMLHMNDTNVLSQVLSYRSQVRQSQPVTLALQLAAAFRDKNYCRFFRLLQNEATFLQCCVAHKLFSATRSNAVAIMVQSYGRNAYPVERLRKVLAFDSIEDVTLLLKLHGLRMEGNDQVILNRDDFNSTDAMPLQSYLWIDAKKEGKLSQVVHGSDLFQFFASRCDVSNSFNIRDEYAHDPVLEAVLDGSAVINDQSSNFSKSAGSLSMQAAMEQKKKADAERVRKQKEAERDRLVHKLMGNIVDQVVLGLVQEETMKAKIVRKQLEAIEKAKRIKEEQERRRIEVEKERRRREQELAAKLAEKVEREMAEKELRRITELAMAEERERRERKLAVEMADRFWRQVLQTVDLHVKNVCEEMVNEKETILGGLDTFRRHISRRWLLQFWNRWREWVRMKKEDRRKRTDMIRKSVPRWESEEVVNKLFQKYAKPSEDNFCSMFSLLNRPSNSMQLAVFKKNRANRVIRNAFQKWRMNAKKRKTLRLKAEEHQKRQEDFFRRFEKSAILETRFDFEAPEDWMKTIRRKNDQSMERQPLKVPESQSVSFIGTDSSLFVARRHLDEWQPEAEIPSELKDKLKRKREDFEKVCENHSRKKKRDVELFSNEAKKNTEHLEKMSGEADALLNETLRYTEDLDRMIAEIKARRSQNL